MLENYKCGFTKEKGYFTTFEVCEVTKKIFWVIPFGLGLTSMVISDSSSDAPRGRYGKIFPLNLS